MIIKIYDDGRMAEIILKSTAKSVITADMLVRVMTMNGITAAKIITISDKIETKPGNRRPGK